MTTNPETAADLVRTTVGNAASNFRIHAMREALSRVARTGKFLTDHELYVAKMMIRAHARAVSTMTAEHTT